MRQILLAATAVLALAFSAPATAETMTGLQPVKPGGDLKPGLAAEFLNVQVDHVDDIEIAGKGKPGAPIPVLDGSVGGNGDVLGSGRGEEVGVRMRGFLEIEKPGTYEFAAKSNDGVRFQLGGKTVVDDPGVHSDRLSAPTAVELQPGWYPIYMLYFQRRGGWTLELLWKAPGMAEFEPIPAAHLAHLPG